MFIQDIVDYIVTKAVRDSEHWSWVSIVDPHPDFIDLDYSFEDFINEKKVTLSLSGQDGGKRKRCESTKSICGSPRTKKMKPSHQLSIKLPQSTKWEDVFVDDEFVHLSSKEGYCGSPYFRTVPIACSGRHCFGCIQNKC